MIKLIFDLIAQKYPNNSSIDTGPLQFGRAQIAEEYRKKWNIHNTHDFLLLVKDGKPIRDTLYRIGGFDDPKLNKDRYFMLLKHVEAFYSKSITDYTGSDPKHLEGRWCILDKEGNEKIEFESFEHPYLVENSCIYYLNNKYYNIETKELYCSSYTKMESSEYLFLDNKYDKNKDKIGIWKINKNDGTFEIIK